MNRVQLQQLALDRVHDAGALLNAGRWAGAYHLAGYALECGLKACVLAHVQKTGMIFLDRTYLKSLADCWTHDLEKLVELAGLKSDQIAEMKANPTFRINWLLAKD